MDLRVAVGWIKYHKALQTECPISLLRARKLSRQWYRGPKAGAAHIRGDRAQQQHHVKVEQRLDQMKCVAEAFERPSQSPTYDDLRLVGCSRTSLMRLLDCLVVLVTAAVLRRAPCHVPRRHRLCFNPFLKIFTPLVIRVSCFLLPNNIFYRRPSSITDFK